MRFVAISGLVRDDRGGRVIYKTVRETYTSVLGLSQRSAE